MVPRVFLAAPLVALLVAGCDTSDPVTAAADVEFFQDVDGREVVVGRFDAAGQTLDLGDVDRETIRVDPFTYSFSASYSDDLGGFRYVLLTFDDGDGSFGLDVSLLASPPTRAPALAPNARRALARDGRAATAEVAVFAVADPGMRPRGRITLTFHRDAAPDQEFVVDLADNAVVAEPALRVRGSDLSLVEGDDGFGFRIQFPEGTAGVVPLSVYRAGFVRSTDRCSSGDGGAIPPSVEARTGAGPIRECPGVDPDTFDYSLFFLER